MRSGYARTRQLCLTGLLFAALACNGERVSAVRAGIVPDPAIPGLSEGTLSIDDATSSGFGLSVAATDAGPLVAAPQLLVDGKVSGGVIPFSRGVDGWQAAEPLTAPTASDGLNFGAVIAGAGLRVAIANPYVGAGSGAVWVFEHADNQWGATPSAVLGPPAGLTEADFGKSLALTSDLLVVGSDAEDYTGLAYVFEADGNGWSTPKPLTPSDGSLPPEAMYGWAVAANGDTIAVGAPNAGSAGVVFVFERAKDWLEPQILRGAEDAGAPPGANFGLALACDATHLFVGAPVVGDVGAVYVWTLADATWQPQPIVSKRGADVDGMSGDSFGSSLAPPSLGRLFVGAQNAEATTGRVQAHSLVAPNDEEARLSPDPDGGVTYFGISLSTTSSSVVVGAVNRAYVYTLDPGATCASDADCGSQHCVEGVCCDSVCKGGCNSCLAALKSEGADGECGPVRAGTDPADACAESDEPCGTTGTCNGLGVCALVAKNTVCKEAECATASAARPASVCDGRGKCPPATATECEPGFACAAAQCAKACTDDAGCTDGYYCFGGGCVSGSRCSDDGLKAYDARGRETQCSEVFCRDGKCPTTCEFTTDCMSGVCQPEEHTCVESAALSPAKPATSSSCAFAPGGVNDARGVWSSAVFLLWLMRRRRVWRSFAVVGAKNEKIRR